LKEVRLIGKLVVVYLAVVGGFTLLHQLRPWISPATSNAPEHTSFYPSPDGKFRAAIVTFAGGGAISPYCHDAVSVIPATAPDRDAAESHLNVYEGACQSFALKEGVQTSGAASGVAFRHFTQNRVFD
jgi:hypothetical protein